MDSPGSQVRQAFGSGRMTSQRVTIVAAAAGLDAAFTVDDLAAASRGLDSSVGVATVYRAVAAMEQSGWLERVGERGGSALFTRCPADGHHHHVICTACGRTEPAECPLGDVVSADKTAGGFVVTGHQVTLYGLCPACLADGER